MVGEGGCTRTHPFKRVLMHYSHIQAGSLCGEVTRSLSSLRRGHAELGEVRVRDLSSDKMNFRSRLRVNTHPL